MDELEIIYMDMRSFNPKREARPSQTVVGVATAEVEDGFNPKREARPSQTSSSDSRHMRIKRFNPKREARPSQTWSVITSLLCQLQVSIPNGKPGPLRPKVPASPRTHLT